MSESIDIVTIGLKIGEKISFKDNDTAFLVGCGSEMPGGVIMIAYENNRTAGLYSISCLTRKLMGGILPDEKDMYEMWTYKGRTLLSIHNENMKKQNENT